MGAAVVGSMLAGITSFVIYEEPAPLLIHSSTPNEWFILHQERSLPGGETPPVGASVVSCARRGAPNEGLDEGVDERGDPPSSPPPPPRDLASQAPGGAGRMDDGV